MTNYMTNILMQTTEIPPPTECYFDAMHNEMEPKQPCTMHSLMDIRYRRGLDIKDDWWPWALLVPRQWGQLYTQPPTRYQSI